MINTSRSFILLVGDEGTLFLPPRRLSNLIPLFVRKDADKEAKIVLEILDQFPRIPVLLLAAHSGQTYKPETLPPLSPFDRKKLLDRRLDEAFPDVSYKTALISKGDHALLACAKESGTLAFWEEQLIDCSNMSGMLCLLPVESADMAGQLAPETKKGWCLTLSFQKTGGIRQIVTKDGDLVFTRLTPALSSTNSIGYMTATLAIDIKATRDYLTRLGLTSETPLHFVGLMPETLLESMRATPLDVATRHLFTPHDAAVKLGLSQAPAKDTAESDLVHALWLSNKKSPRSLVLKDSKKIAIYNAWIKHIGTMTSIMMAIAAGILLGIALLSLFKNQHAVFEAQEDIARLQKSFLEQQTSSLNQPYSLENLRKAIERKRLFVPEKIEVLDILKKMSTSIPQETRIHTLDWSSEGLVLTFKISEKEPKEGSKVLLEKLRETLPDYSVEFSSPQDSGQSLSNTSEEKKAEEMQTSIFLIKRRAP